ncbi:MAG: gliding motility-associated C-terminal domain-containing protein [Cyclobacteriaceae bacterium]|nr:gliding motility-associated C-terminal domain-containing protein [Cyclobacteriaceae bacterium]
MMRKFNFLPNNQSYHGLSNHGLKSHGLINHGLINYGLINYGLILLLLLHFNTFAQTINRAEYFIDLDPGNGNGTPVTVSSPAANVSFSFTVPTTALSPGFHRLGFRIRQNNELWSHSSITTFYIFTPPVTSSNLVTGEYFFDNDPGFGNGTAIAFTPGASVNLALPISISSLSPGFHFIVFRFRDNRGRWTHGDARPFYIFTPVVSDPATSITRAEYFFNTDLGPGNNTPLTITPGSPQNNSFAINLPSSLTPGFHRIGFRYRDNKNRWSHAEIRTFYIFNTSALPNRQIVAAQYFIDDVHGTGTGIPIPGIVPGAAINQLVALDMTGVPTGNHTLSIRVKDSEGVWSLLLTAPFTVSPCTPPPSPTVPGASRCGPGTVTLNASGATGSQQYRWYDDPILNNLVHTGTPFVTPALTATKSYYVSIFDPGTNCESSRVPVTATIVNIPKPAINPSGSLSICEGSFVFLSAPSGYAQYIWQRDGSTLSAATQQILANQSGSYTVQVGNGTCQSEPSDAVVLTVIPAPPKPVITITGNTVICGSGSVELSGPAGFEYSWSNGATTQSITVNATGVYFLVVKTPGANCPSLPSDPVVVTVLTPPCGGGNPINQPPVINTTPLASQIEGRVQVDLTQVVSDPDNNLDFSTLRVMNNETARGVAAFIDAAYNLIIDYAGNPFTGIDRITLEVCDLDGVCVQQVIDIEVVGEIVVFNGITPNGDGYNDFLLIKYIGVVEGSESNRVRIFNRWGQVVFETKDYDNLTRVFTGVSADGKDLPAGTYFYTIDLANGKTYNGFLTLKR